MMKKYMHALIAASCAATVYATEVQPTAPITQEPAVQTEVNEEVAGDAKDVQGKIKMTKAQADELIAKACGCDVKREARIVNWVNRLIKFAKENKVITGCGLVALIYLGLNQFDMVPECVECDFVKFDVGTIAGYLNPVRYWNDSVLSKTKAIVVGAVDATAIAGLILFLVSNVDVVDEDATETVETVVA